MILKTLPLTCAFIVATGCDGASTGESLVGGP
jgi:hypothetical protein